MGAPADLQAYLTDVGIVGGSTDWPSVLGAMHDGTATNRVDRLVGFRGDGGMRAETPADPGSQGDAAWMYPQVQVRVRGAPGQGPGEVADKMLEIFEAVHGKLGVTMGEHEYARVLALTSEPAELGPDDNGRDEMTISYQMTRHVRALVSL